VAYIVIGIIRSIIIHIEFGYLFYVLDTTLLALVGGAIARTLEEIRQIQLTLIHNNASFRRS
jgi:hypothetical protein